MANAPLQSKPEDVSTDTGLARADTDVVAGELANALAERIRALGHIAPAAFGDSADRSVVESKTTIATAEAMIGAWVKDNEAVARRLRKAVGLAAVADDVFTADMLTARTGQHEQNVWMFRATAS